VNAATEPATPTPTGAPIRRRRWILGVFFAIAAWFAACWWITPLSSSRLQFPEGAVPRLLGFAEDGSLIGAAYDSAAGRLTIRAWAIPSMTERVIWTDPQNNFNLRRFDFQFLEGHRWISIRPQASDRSIRDQLLDLRDGRTIELKHRGPAWISPDGRLVFVDDRASGIAVSELATGRDVGRIDESWIDAISPDGRWVAAESAREIHLWRIDGDRIEMVTGFHEVVPDPSIRAVGEFDVEDHARICAFDCESRRFVVCGSSKLTAWSLEPLSLIGEVRATSPTMISSDGAMAFDRDGSRRVIETGAFLPVAGGLRPKGMAPTQTGSWFLAGIQSSVVARGPAVPRFDLGPYTITVIRNDGNRYTYSLCDVVNGIEVTIPRGLLPKPEPSRAARQKLLLHPRRIALHNEVTGETRIIEMPPQRPWAKQIGFALLLFALPGWWCWRGRKISSGFRSGESSSPLTVMK
jgi:hypothetical protein